ncbi:MAG: serine/threonine-protein kinase, partial [Candidatus Binatia bacterium]
MPIQIAQTDSDFSSLRHFRQQVYPLLGPRKDVLFELMDAVIQTPHARSFAELSLAPACTRQWPSIYHAALELEAGERTAFLDRACDGDEELRREVESLLAAHDEDGSFLEAPALEVAAGLITESRHPTMSGRRFGHYEILSRLGAGGMGEVYLAKDAQLGRKVALKLLPARFTNDPERVGRFERVARAASALNHPNIITIHEIGEADRTHYIATEYVDGVTLRQRMAGGRIELEDAMEIAIQVARALAEAHAAGIVHRDIKLENVMLRRDGLVKVLDFGLAKLTEERQEDKGTRGQGDKETREQRENSLLPLSPCLPLSLPGTVLG